MLTAAITGAIAWILDKFGIPPGPYLAVVAIVVKGIIVLVGVLLGAKAVKKVKARQVADKKPPPAAEDKAPPPVET